MEALFFTVFGVSMVRCGPDRLRSSSDSAPGMLATSRGFGDASLKPVVLATPEIFPRQREADDVAIVRLSFIFIEFPSLVSLDSLF